MAVTRRIVLAEADFEAIYTALVVYEQNCCCTDRDFATAEALRERFLGAWNTAESVPAIVASTPQAPV